MERLIKEKFIADMKQGKLAVIASANAPISRNCIWVKDGVLYGYTNDGWENITDDYYDKLKKIPFTVVAITDGHFELNKTDYAPESLNMQYSYNGGEWTDIDFDNPASFDVVIGDTVALRGDNQKTSVCGHSVEDNQEYNYINWLQFTGQWNIYGNIMSLLYKENFEYATTIPDAAFANLFCDFDFWDETETFVDASDLVLPFEIATPRCCYFMFAENVALKRGPRLPAKTLSHDTIRLEGEGYAGCYESMFENCKSLEEAPELPALEATESCYCGMFYGCENLKKAPKLPALTLGAICYFFMFEDCVTLAVAPELPAKTLAKKCYDGMFRGCTSLVVPPILPATTLTQNCYSNMFQDCTSLTAAPVLPAFTLEQYCYSGMFRNCASLASVEIHATDISANYCLSSWLENASSTGTFKCVSDVNYPSGDSGIPSGWTRVDI